MDIQEFGAVLLERDSSWIKANELGVELFDDRFRGSAEWELLRPLTNALIVKRVPRDSPSMHGYTDNCDDGRLYSGSKCRRQRRQKSAPRT